MAERTIAGAEDSGGQVEPRTPYRTTRLPYLMTAALVLLALLLYLMPSDPTMLARVNALKQPFYRAEQFRQLAGMMGNDPRLGARVAPDGRSPLREALRRAGPGKPPVVVLVIGTCSTCAAEGLTRWCQIVARHPGRSAIVVSRSTPAGVAAFVRSHRFPLPMVSDASGEITKRLNPLWAPRAYAVAGDGSLVWIQKDPEAAPEALASGLWDGRKG
jgi:hypothetical protein